MRQTIVKNRVLFVDDEPNVLDGIRRQLRKRYDVHTAIGPEEGLALIRDGELFEVVVSDMKMPGMNGAEFLSVVRDESPESVRMILSGQSELDTAIRAINEGSIFRFLTKPCSPEVLIRGVDLALEQSRLIRVERELLEQTLSGAIKVVTEVLGIVNPDARRRAARIERYADQLSTALEIKDWRLGLAALLSQLGCITIPDELSAKAYSAEELSKEEFEMFSSHSDVTARLIGSIPRLDGVADIISQQFTPANENPLGHILRAAVAFDRMLCRGISREGAQIELRDGYDLPEALAQKLGALRPEVRAMAPRSVSLSELQPEMIIEADVLTKTGVLLVPRGEELTVALLERMRNFARGTGVVEPIQVLAPAEMMCAS